jgi:hypothetical protein
MWIMVTGRPALAAPRSHPMRSAPAVSARLGPPRYARGFRASAASAAPFIAPAA